MQTSADLTDSQLRKAYNLMQYEPEEERYVDSIERTYNRYGTIVLVFDYDDQLLDVQEFRTEDAARDWLDQQQENP